MKPVVRSNSAWVELLGVQNAVVEGIEYDEEAGHPVVGVRVRSKDRRRCGHCGKRSAKEDAGDGRRTWRTLDLGTVPAFIEAEAPRVECREHGVVVAAVAWARHASRYTRNFEDHAAWLAAAAFPTSRRTAGPPRARSSSGLPSFARTSITSSGMTATAAATTTSSP